MNQWFKSREGRQLMNNERQYLGPMADQPFPNNPLFRSQPVLDNDTKELIWEKVTQRGEALKSVSAEMGVDVRRVAAVVRLKQVEKQWIKDVSCCAVLFDLVFAVRDEITIFYFSISLEDLYMVRRLLLIRLLDILSCLFLCL